MRGTEKSNRPRRAVASSETAREINRDILLHTIHLHQPVSRADLARLTGLQPSTVSVIIGQLIDEGWVLPGNWDGCRAARRPTFVTLNDRHVTLAIDLRPGRPTWLSWTSTARSWAGIQSPTKSRPAHSRGGQDGHCADCAGGAIAAAQPSATASFRALGVSVSGRVDQKTHRLLFSPNAPWGQIDLHAELQRVLETPIEMENAANACLFSERWFGNFGDASNMLVVSVSEGIGAGMLVDGRVVRGRDDMAGEFGHMPLEETGPVCGCGSVGCWETFASNRAGTAVLPGTGAGKHADFVSGTARAGSEGRHPRAAFDRQNDDLPGARVGHAYGRAGAGGDHYRGRVHGTLAAHLPSAGEPA